MSAGADRKVVFALLAVAALCLIGLGATLYRGKAAQLRGLEQELSDKEAQYVEVRAKLASQPELETTYAQLQARLSVLEPALPDSAYIPTFLRQIEGLATGTRNTIIGIRPKPVTRNPAAASAVEINNETGEITEAADQAGPASPAGPAGPAVQPLPYDYVPIELKLEGTYWTVIDFLEELQQFPKMIAVNEVGFYPSQAGSDARQSPDLAATMELTAVVTKGGNDGTAH
jgi:Tfp pilus assembly protein PilO